MSLPDIQPVQRHRIEPAPPPRSVRVTPGERRGLLGIGDLMVAGLAVVGALRLWTVIGPLLQTTMAKYLSRTLTGIVLRWEITVFRYYSRKSGGLSGGSW